MHIKIYILLFVLLLVFVVFITVRRTAAAMIDQNVYNITVGNLCLNLEPFKVYDRVIPLTSCPTRSWVYEADGVNFRIKTEDDGEFLYIGQKDFITRLVSDGIKLTNNKQDSFLFKLENDILTIVSGGNDSFKGKSLCLVTDGVYFDSGTPLSVKLTEGTLQEKKLKRHCSISNNSLFILSKIKDTDYFMSMCPEFTSNTFAFCCTCFGLTCNNCYNSVLPVSYHKDELYGDYVYFKERPIDIPQNVKSAIEPYKWKFQKVGGGYYISLLYKCKLQSLGFEKEYYLKVVDNKPIVSLQNNFQVFTLVPGVNGYFIVIDNGSVLSYSKGSLEFLPMSNESVEWEFYGMEGENCTTEKVKCSCSSQDLNRCVGDAETCKIKQRVRICKTEDCDRKSLDTPFSICKGNYCLTSNAHFKQGDKTQFKFEERELKPVGVSSCLDYVKNTNILSIGSCDNKVTVKRLINDKIQLVNEDGQCARFWGFSSGIPFTSCDRDDTLFDVKF